MTRTSVVVVMVREIVRLHNNVQTAGERASERARGRRVAVPVIMGEPPPKFCVLC